MVRNTLISVRVEKELLDKIEDLMVGKPYLNRSRVINCLLSAMLKCAICGQVDKILDSYDPYDAGIVIRCFNLQGKPLF